MRRITNERMNEFKLYLIDEERSDATIEKYMRDLRFFSIWLNGAEISKSLVLRYKQELCEKYAPASVNSIISSLNSFFIYNEWYDLKLKALKIQKQMFANKEKELTKAEYERLLNAAKQNKSHKLYYLMQTICSTGIRVSELKFITVEAIKNRQATFRLAFFQRLCERLFLITVKVCFLNRTIKAFWRLGKNFAVILNARLI